MEKLFDDTLFIQKERPTQITKQQEEKMWLDLAKECIKNQYSDGDEETIAEDLKELSIHDSGFEKAKDLEQNGNADYEFEGDFIDWLDGIDWKRGAILRENTKLWVKAHNPQPKFQLGQKLIIEKELNREKHVGDIVYINGVNTEDAYYLVDKDKNRKGGTVIVFEKIEENCSICLEQL